MTFYYVIRPLLAVNAQKILSAQADWEAGEYYNGALDTKSSSGFLKIKSGNVGTWNAGTPGFAYDNAGYDYWTYDGASYGASLTTDGTYVYEILGNRRPYLFRYNPETNTWKQLANAPTAFFYGASITYDAHDKAIYAIDGGDGSEATNVNNATKHMFKYDIAADTWSKLPNDAPDVWTLGSSIVSNGNGKIYAIRAFLSAQLPDAFWVYNTATGIWTSTLPTTTTNISSTNGQPLLYSSRAYNGKCTQGCVYALNGGAATGFNRYDIAENQWYVMPVAPGNAGYGSSMSLDSANGIIYMHTGNQLATFAKFTIDTETWDGTVEDTQGVVYNGGAQTFITVNGTGYVYQLKGYALPDMWRFNTSLGASGQWESIATPTTTATVGNGGEGGTVVYVANLGASTQCTDAGGCLFVFRAGNTNTMWRYNISARTWTSTMTVTNLGNLQWGGSACRAGNYLYATRGGATATSNDLYQFNLMSATANGDPWVAMTDMPTTDTAVGAYPASPTPEYIGYGGGITCLGTNVYAAKGYGWSSAAIYYYSNHFFKFDGADWSQLRVTPQRMGQGGALAAVPYDAGHTDWCADTSGCIFAFMGNQRGDWYRYNISTDLWNQLTDLPSATYYTASLEYDGAGMIYATSGDYDKKVWRYNIADGSWTRMADFPGKAGYNNALAYGGTTLYALNGMGDAGIYKFTPSANNYIATGTWISAIQDLDYVNSWTQLSTTLTTAGSSTVDIAMRSSIDKVTWSDWETVISGGTGPSTSQNITAGHPTEQRYVQFKVTLNSDGTNTPSIDSITLSYDTDGTPPTNPTASGWSTSAKVTPITSANPNGYYYTNPYFELSGATDAGAGVAGYYIAWTTDSGFDPSSSADYYQTGTTFRVNTSMVTASPGPLYYLRVATKDNAGVVSTAATAFTYTYTGIASASTTAWTQQTDPGQQGVYGFETSGATCDSVPCTGAQNVNTRANGGIDMTLGSISPGTWMDLPAIGSNNGATAFTAYNDTSVAWDGNDTIYVLRSVASQTFAKYSIANKTWTSLANTGVNMTYGSAIVYVGPGMSAGCTDAQGCIYATVGGTATGFRQYSIQAGTWAAKAVVSAGVTYGAGLIYPGTGDYIYATVGNSVNTYRYQISIDTWTPRAAVDANIYQGAAYAYVPNGTYCADESGCIFATRGNSSNHFYRYDIGANSWSYLSAPPTAAPSKSNYGAAMVYNNGSLYFVSGYYATDFLKYDIANDLWTTLADLPATHYYGSTNALVYDTTSDIIYTPRMTNEYAFISYDVVNNKWRNPAIPHAQSTTGFYYGGMAFDGTDSIYVARGNATNDFFKYTISTQTWQRLNDIPLRMNSGSDLIFVNGTVYAMTGTVVNAEPLPRFYSYNPTTDTWTRLTDLPSAVTYGSQLVWDGSNTIYTAQGSSQVVFNYSISGNTWMTTGALNSGFIYHAAAFSDVTTQFNTGGPANYVPMFTAVNDYVYIGVDSAFNAIQFNLAVNGSASITPTFEYCKTANCASATAFTPQLDGTSGMTTSGSIVWDSTAFVGWVPVSVNASSAQYFIRIKRSNVAAITPPQSDTVKIITSAFNIAPAAIGAGGCAVVDATDTYMYQVRGGGNTNIYRCTIDQGAGTCAWSPAGTLNSAPGAMQYGDACAISNGSIFVPRGNTNNTDFYVYDITGNSWTTRALNNFYYYGRLLTGPNDILYGFRGYSTSTMDRYVQQSSTMSFQRSGTWMSQIVDLGSVFSLSGITTNQTLGTENTALKYETRTCSDSGCQSDPNDSDWSTWMVATNNKASGATTNNYSIDSAAARYFQLRVTPTSDRVYTPTINDFTINYYVDGTAPNNPSVPVNGYTDSGKTSTIPNDTWENDLTPYFEWTTTDNAGGIGVDGSYVYFGTDATKDPVTDANDPTNLAYKSGTNYYAASVAGMSSWNALTQSASALTDGIYYLRIKVKDHNGNITTNPVNAFTVKVDGSQPNNISNLAITSNYMLSTDAFSFSWTAVNDEGPSGVQQYYYQRGSLPVEHVLAADACTGGLCTLTNIAHYTNRVNTIAVWAVDTALNESEVHATAGYFYTGPAPTVPQSVTVDPGSQVDTDSFAVSWTLPHTCLGQTPCAAGDILQYCYTINVEPSPGTCGTNTSGNPTPSADGGWTTSTQTSAQSLPAFSAATRQDENIVYIVAKDAVGNIDYANYTSQTFTFTSNAPSQPQNLEAADSSDRASGRYAITLTWDVPEDAGSGVEGYKIYRCTDDCENPSIVDDPPANYTVIATVNTLGYLDTSLDHTVTYTYFARSTGAGSNISGNSAVVSLKPEGKFKAAPAMSGMPTASVRIRSAVIEWLTLNDQDRDGNVIPHTATSFVQYGTSAAYGSETGNSDYVSDHSVTVTSLSPNTTYHYRTKWVDVDGNIGFSSDFTMTTLGAPSAPRNLKVDVALNTINRFGFTWDKPNDEGVTVAGYFYVVNNLPNKDNVKFTAQTSLSPYAAATRQGTNTFYVVATDDAGNVNYDNYTSIDFEAHTVPPSEPQNVTITDSSNRDTKRYSITLTWDPPALVTSQGDDDSGVLYTIYRSEDAGTTFNSIASLKSTGYLDTGLDSLKTYTYKIVANDTAGATSQSTTPVAKQPQGRYTTPPAITETPSVQPDSFSGMVNWRTERIATSFVDFGTTQTSLDQEQGTADQTDTHAIKITGLKAKTTYFYKVKSIDVDQNIAFSEVSSFTTLEAPRVMNVKISDVRLKDAIISWEVNKEATAIIKYGKTANYGLTYTADNNAYSVKHTVKLENLSDGSTYHVRLGGVDRNNNPIESDDYQFTTLTFPKVSDVTTKNQSQGQTEVHWKTNVPTTSSVEYYGDTIPPKTQGNASLVTDHSVLLFGLEDATKYKFVLHGADQFGYEAVSSELTFTTLEDTTPPEIFGVKSESNTIGSGETSKIQIVVSWKSNEAATSMVEYGVGISGDTFTDATDESAELLLDHLVVISGLAPAKTYHFRVVSRDKAGNQTKSGSNTVLTTRQRDSFIQLIITNLQSTFSWLGNIGSLGK